MRRKPSNREIEPAGGRAPGAQAILSQGRTVTEGWVEVYEGARVVELLCDCCRRSLPVDWNTWGLAARTRLERARTAMREHHVRQHAPAAAQSATLQRTPEQAALF